MYPDAEKHTCNCCTYTNTYTYINLYKYPNNRVIKDMYTLPGKTPLLHYTSQVPPIHIILPATGLGIMTGCFPGVLSNFMNVSTKKKEDLLFCSLWRVLKSSLVFCLRLTSSVTVTYCKFNQCLFHPHFFFLRLQFNVWFQVTHKNIKRETRLRIDQQEISNSAHKYFLPMFCDVSDGF